MAMTRTLIEDGLSRSAEEMQKLGLVNVVCAPGEGEGWRFIAMSSRTAQALRGVA